MLLKHFMTSSDWAPHRSVGRRHHSHHLRLQPGSKARRHPTLCDSSWDSLHSHPRPLRGLLQVCAGCLDVLSWCVVSEMNRYIIAELYVTVLKEEYCLCLRIVCRTEASGGEKTGHVSVEVSGGQFGRSSQTFSYQVHFSSILISWIFGDLLCHLFFL